MKSIAIWYNPASPKDGMTYVNSLELHVNLWKLPNNKLSYDRFIDIGLKLPNTTSIDELKIYVPAIIEKDDFCDIVSKFIRKPDLVSAIFNENYKTLSNGHSKLHTITDNDNKKLFDIYESSPEDLSIEHRFNGTIFTIKCPSNPDETYFRFRLKGKYLKTLSDIQKPSNAFIQSAFSKIELIDFRVNEARDLDKSLLEHMEKAKKLTFSKAHFFFICSSSEDVIGSHKPFKNCRNLENYRWKGYIDTERLNEDRIFLAYHWTEKSDSPDKTISDFGILIKSKFESNNIWTILAYVLGLAIFAILFNIATDYILPHVHRLFKPS